MMPDNLYGMLVKLVENADANAIRAIIKRHGGIVVDERVMNGLWLVVADADNFSPLMKELDRREDTAYTHRDRSSSCCTYTPNDYYYDGGQRSILEMIGVPDAWQITRGSQNVGGAVLDTGVDLNHPDLIANHQVSILGNDMWSLPPLHQHGTMVAGVFASHNDTGKVAGVAGGCKYMSVKCSSNGNLYDSDLIRSLQIIIDRNPVGGPKQDPWLKAINLSYGGLSYAPVSDYTPNSIKLNGDFLDNLGVRVVFETSGLALKTGTITGEEILIEDPYDDPEFLITTTTLTITWDTGITPLDSKPSKVYFTAPAVEEIVNTLWDMGYLFFLAAGNDNERAVNWFYTTKGITVGSCTDTARESYSNYGPWVDIAAPGELMMNTAPTTDISSFKIQLTVPSVVAGSAVQDVTYSGSYSIQSFLITPITPAVTGVFDEGTYIVSAQNLGGSSYRLTLNKPALQGYSSLAVTVFRWRDYSAGSGTSFATPIVMAASLLAWSVNESLTNAQVKDILLNTATPLDPYHQLGAGKVNVLAAVQAALPEGVSIGFITAPSASLRPSVSVPSLAGNVVDTTGSISAASVTLRPSVSAFTLTGVQVGAMSAPSITLRPSVAVPSIAGVVEGVSIGSISAPSTTVQILVNPPTLVGVTAGTAIRAPSGEVWDLRDIYGAPLDIRAIV